MSKSLKRKNKVVIVIGGRPGAGKTSLSQHIAKKFNLRYVSAGMIFRNLAEQRGFASEGKGFLEWHRFLEKHAEFDRQVDRKLASEARKGCVVIEGWLAGRVIKKANFKIFLDAPLNIAAKRISLREHGKGEMKITEAREQSNRRRWKRIYNADPDDISPYNLVINTKYYTQQQTAVIVDNILEKLIK